MGTQVIVNLDKLTWRTATSFSFTWGGGGGTVRDTKLMSARSSIPPTLKHKSLSSDGEYQPEGKVVYDPDVPDPWEY